MADPAPQEPRISRFDDPTRDIRLPRAPGSPPLVVRPEWSSYAAPSAPEAATVAPDPGPPTRAQLLAGEPTDELFPPGGLQRDPTLKFEQGAGAPPAVAPPPVAPRAAAPPDDRGRRWPWVLIALLPIIVIVGSGIWLFILLSHP
jgi:hypothetical protein